MISGKGGVGKTSLAASLACKLAEGMLPRALISVNAILFCPTPNSCTFPQTPGALAKS